MHATLPTTRPTTSDGGRNGEHLTDDEATSIIRAGFAFDALLIVIGLIAIAAGQIAGGLGVIGLGVAAFVAGWVATQLASRSATHRNLRSDRQHVAGLHARTADRRRGTQDRWRRTISSA
jgi:hypothetical protein